MGFERYQKPALRIHFSKKEIQDILLSMGVVTLAFAIAFSSGLGIGILEINWGFFPSALLISFVAVGTGFLCHELGHKFVANKYGAWAEFRASIQGLMMAILFALIAGVVFAAPGAVYVAGNITKEQNGKISIAGPLINLVFAAIFFPFIFITTGLVWTIVFYVYYINTFLAVFNLLPFMPFDGAKVVKWNIGAYIGILGLAISLLIPAVLIMWGY